MTLPVRGPVRANKDGKFDDRLAASIGERLIALEKTVSAAFGEFAAPTAPSFGGGAPGSPGAPGPPGTPGTSGVTDHGALTGLEDNDHPQYVQQLEPAATRPHTHSPDDVIALDQRFYRRGESARPAPHVHNPEDVAGLDQKAQNQRTPHAHMMADVADLRPEDAQFILASKMFGGY